jgi:tRNA(fMet)-specific endonuclease VapC
MAARYLLDTNTCIYIRRQRPARVREKLDRLGPGEAVLSIISYGELRYGVEKSNARAQALHQIEEFISVVEVAPLPAEAAAVYGVIRATLAAKGELIGSNDIWIAAHAIAAKLTLVTNNEREFRRIAGLKIENWAA